MSQSPDKSALVLAMARYNGSGFSPEEVRDSYKQIRALNVIDSETDYFINATLGKWLLTGILVSRAGRYFANHC